MTDEPTEDKQAAISTARQCKGRTKSGAPCRVATLRGSDYCFTHDPATAQQRKAARSKGGAARHGRMVGVVGQPEKPISVKTIADIVALLERAINDCFAMEKSLARARTVGYLAIAACKALEVADLAARIETLEEAYGQKR